MAGVGPLDLKALATELLVAATAALDTIPSYDATLDGSQPRVFVSPGQPADDCCDQLSVQVGTLSAAPTSPQGLPAGKLHDSARVNHVQLLLRSTRCVPTVDGNGNFPTVLELEASSDQLYADGWAIWNHIFNMLRAELLFSRCDEVFWDGGRMLVPSGGCGGWVFTFRVSFDGYEEVLGT